MPRHAAVASCIAILMHSKRKDSLDAMQQASRFGYESDLPQMRSQRCRTLKRQIVLHRRTAFDQGVQITSTAEGHAQYVQRALDLGRERRAFLAENVKKKMLQKCLLIVGVIRTDVRCVSLDLQARIMRLCARGFADAIVEVPSR